MANCPMILLFPSARCFQPGRSCFVLAKIVPSFLLLAFLVENLIEKADYWILISRARRTCFREFSFGYGLFGALCCDSEL